VIYRHNVAHDGSLSRLLSALQVDVMVWPGMGSEVVFELYKKDTTTSHTSTAPSSASGYYIRVLWKGQVSRSSNPSLGLMDMVPLKTVLGYFDGLVGVGASLVMGKCNGSIPF
jgi:acid phosphatase